MVEKPTKMLVIRSKDKKSFVENFNSNLPSSDFMEKCRKAGKLIGGSKKS